MYPSFLLLGTKVYMTGIGIVVAFLSFIGVMWYLSKRYLQSFWKFFYWLPLLILLVYLLGSYTQFVFSSQHLFPHTWAECLSIISPYGYKFHFTGILLGILIALFFFFKTIKTQENKLIWADVFFFAFSLCLVPLGIFLFFGDNFIGLSGDTGFSVKSLHSESQWNKFDMVLPIGLFLSLGSLFIAFFFLIKRRISTSHKNFIRYGMLGLSILLIFINVVLLFQQYPRYFVIGIGPIKLDIKQHISFFIIMLCLYLHKKRNTPKLIVEK